MRRPSRCAQGPTSTSPKFGLGRFAHVWALEGADLEEVQELAARFRRDGAPTEVEALKAAQLMSQGRRILEMRGAVLQEERDALPTLTGNLKEEIARQNAAEALEELSMSFDEGRAQLGVLMRTFGGEGITKH